MAVKKKETPKYKGRVKLKKTASSLTRGGLTEKKAKKVLASGKATLTSSNRVPITKKTYSLETKRTGSTKGYEVKDGKYYKLKKIIK